MTRLASARRLLSSSKGVFTLFCLVLLTGPLHAQSVSTDRLREIEELMLPATLRVGDPRLKSLPEYYKESNGELCQRFARAKAAFANPAGHPFRMVTLIAGDAGIGKTFIKNEAFRKDYPDSVVCRFDIGELYADWHNEGLVEARPDLYAEAPGGDVVLNRLLAVSDDQPLKLRQFMESQQASIYLLDSLDEIHPDDCERVLEQVEHFVFDNDRPFVHVVVLGRSIAFRDYWHRRAGFYSSDQMDIFLINPPRFATTGDLLVSTWNYHCYFHDLKVRRQGRDPETMPFAHFSEWYRAGFPKQFAGVTVQHKPCESLSPDVSTQLQTWAREHRVVNAMIYNLAGNGFIRQIAERHAVSGQSYDESQVMDEYLTLWLKRDTKSNNRPSLDKPQHLELYMRLLEEIAAKYAAEKRLSSDGYFDVHYNDVIHAEVNGAELRFPVYRILNRSGLRHSDPRHGGCRRYRFEPVWLHRHLVDRYNHRREKSAVWAELSQAR